MTIFITICVIWFVGFLICCWKFLKDARYQPLNLRRIAVEYAALWPIVAVAAFIGWLRG